MKCFYHPEVFSVGTCVQCAKTACRDCINDIGGALLCRSCLDLQSQQAEIEAEQQQILDQAQASWARDLIIWSWIVAGVGALVGAIAALANISEATAGTRDALPLPAALLLSPVLCAFSAYMFWAYYWGLPTVWRWWRQFTSNVGCFVVANPIVLIFLFVAFCYIPFMIAGYYGFFGGALYQYFKQRKIATSGRPLSSQQKKILAMAGGVLSLCFILGLLLWALLQGSPGARGQTKTEDTGSQKSSAICSDASDKALENDSPAITMGLHPTCWSGTVTADERSISYARANSTSVITTKPASGYSTDSLYSVFCGNGNVYESVRGTMQWYLNRGCPPPYRFRGVSALEVWTTRSAE